MVPVRVRKEQVDFLRPVFCEPVAQAPYARASVDDDEVAGGALHLYAGGVAAVLEELLAGNGNRASRAPAAYQHGSPSRAVFRIWRAFIGIVTLALDSR